MFYNFITAILVSVFSGDANVSTLPSADKNIVADKAWTLIVNDAAASAINDNDELFAKFYSKNLSTITSPMSAKDLSEAQLYVRSRETFVWKTNFLINCDLARVQRNHQCIDTQSAFTALDFKTKLCPSFAVQSQIFIASIATKLHAIGLSRSGN